MYQELENTSLDYRYVRKTKISKDIGNVNNSIKFVSNTQRIQIILKHTRNVTKFDQALGHKESINKFQDICIIQFVFVHCNKLSKYLNLKTRIFGNLKNTTNSL